MSRCTRWVDDGTIACTDWTQTATATCSQWADDGSNQCQSWADDGSNQCQSWADDGSNQCSSWADDGYNECCDWAPCSWFCDAVVWVSNWVCQGWYWVSNWVCQAWYWVSNWVCQAWYWVADWVCTAVSWLVQAVCVIWSWIADWACIAWDTARCAFSTTFKRRKPSGRIKHVFVLMLENRAFDHMLGFSGLTGNDSVSGQPTELDGLVGNPQSNVDPSSNRSVAAGTPAAFKISAPEVDPGHEFDDVVVQLCGDGAVYDSVAQRYPPIDNDGFIASYAQNGDPTPAAIMNCFTVDQLPVLTALAAQFAVCDQWFSSMPGPTWPNRFFIHAASSGGLDDSPSSFQTVTSTLLDGYRFENGTIYDELEDACLDWQVFMGDELPQVFAISGMTDRRLEGNFTKFDEFASAVKDPGYDATYTFIEPNYGNVLPTTAGDFTCGDSQHPLDDVTRGEHLVKKVYETIRNSPHWNDSILLVTYDEHGGFFDHVAPPSTVSPGDTISDESNNHHNFDFRQLGVRVPAVVISPRIPAGTIDHTVYDHTSLLATLEGLFDLPPLTDRDAQANTFANLLSLASPRTDAPTTLPQPATSGFRCDDDPKSMVRRRLRAAAPADAQTLEPVLVNFLHVAFLRDYRRASLLARPALVRRFLAIKSRDQALAYMREVANRMRRYSSKTRRRARDSSRVPRSRP